MMTRQEFLRSLAGLSAGAFVVACTKSDGSPEPTVDAKSPDGPGPTIDAPPVKMDAPPAMSCNTTSSQISANHGHALTVPIADVMAGVDKMYNIKGASAHPHMITITAAQFAMIKANTAITVTSSNDAGHTHDVTVTCA